MSAQSFQNKTALLILMAAPALGGLLGGCGGKGGRGNDMVHPYYLIGKPENRETLNSLFERLGREDTSQEEQFSLVRELAYEYIRLNASGHLINFLSLRTTRFPNDPYNAYYLLLIAHGYMQQEAFPVAALYFDLIIKNYPDLTVRGESIHLACLRELINLVDEPEQRILYYEELIARFPGHIDPGPAYFQLAQAYERAGDWNRAIKTYTDFLPYHGTVVNGFADAYIYAKQLVDFYNSPKDWTFENLNTLRQTIERALDGGNGARLWSYRAKVNFFARSWTQADEDNAGMAEFNISDFMRNKQISYAPELDAASNANEVYLRTWGWAQGISTWYLCFRKIYFPPDPDIHGRWEWAGVYYGEKF